MAKSIMANKTIGAVIVADNCSKTHKTRSLTRPPKPLIDKPLLEKIPLAGIQVAGVSEPWPQNYVNAKYQCLNR